MDNDIKKTISPPDEAHTIRCPRLGHNLSFSYCRVENNGIPCFKTLDCWFEYFDVQAYFETKLNPEQMQQLFCKPPKTKMVSLLELIKQAQAHTQTKPPAKTQG